MKPMENSLAKLWVSFDFDGELKLQYLKKFLSSNEEYKKFLTSHRDG